jgi:predicted Ser/Thr protein kinase
MAEERCWGECGGARPAETPQGLCRECLAKLSGQSGVKTGQDNIPTSATPPADFVSPEPAELAGQFPQLEILELIGQGGMGVVYKARQKQLDRLVALKFLPPHPGQTPAFSDRFTREARSLARLNHPRIVSVYDFGRTAAGLHYFIMEFVDGTDLRHVIRTGELSTVETMAIIPQICEALQYAHDEGVVHRDIKPENILLTSKGQVKIADFGLAKLLGRPRSEYALTHSGQRMGTPHYMAPEQIEHPETVDHRADIYSLGVVFYEMLTGELPLGRFSPPSQKAHVDARLDGVVLRTLEKEPERRYQRVSDVKTEIETISSGGHVAAATDAIADHEFEAVQRQLRGPASGLKVAGIINCITFVLTLVGWMVLAITHGATALGTVVTGSIGLMMAAMGLLTVVAAQRMVQLQSYGLAIAASVLQFVALPGSLLGLWMGIWALVVLTRDEVHRAFIRATEQDLPVADSAVWKAAVNIGALTASFVFMLTLVVSLGRRQLPWFVFLFGPSVAILDLFALGQWRRQAAPGYKSPWECAKIEFERIVGKRVAASTPVRSPAIKSFALGILCILLLSSHLTFAVKFATVFLSGFFAIFLGLRVLKSTHPYRVHLLDASLAAAGILTATLSILALFTG